MLERRAPNGTRAVDPTSATLGGARPPPENPTSGPLRDEQQLLVIDVRRAGAVLPWPHGVDRLDRQAAADSEQAELAGREARCPEVGLGVPAGFVLDDRALVVDAA